MNALQQYKNLIIDTFKAIPDVNTKSNEDIIEILNNIKLPTKFYNIRQNNSGGYFIGTTFKPSFSNHSK